MYHLSARSRGRTSIPSTAGLSDPSAAFVEVFVEFYRGGVPPSNPGRLRCGAARRVVGCEQVDGETDHADGAGMRPCRYPCVLGL